MDRYVHVPVIESFVDHFLPPIVLPPLGFLGLPFGYPPPNVFLALLAFEKCSGPCNSSVRLPPFLPIALAAAERGLGFLGFISVLYHKRMLFVK